MDVLNLLRKDHSALKNLFSRFEKTSKSAYDKREELFDQIRRELHLHSRVEEEIFYPAVKAFNGTMARALVSEALREHKELDQLLTQISRLRPSDKKFDDKMETLFEHMDNHIEEEEGEIFQFVEENCSREQLEDLGLEIEDRKKVLARQMAA